MLGTIRTYQSSSAAHHRAVAILHRPEGLVGRNGGTQIVKIAGILALLRLLHLERLGRMNFAAIGANTAFAKQRIVGLHFFHLRNDCLSHRRHS